MKIQSRPFGEIDIDERQILTFPKGLLGFGDYKSFALLDSPQKPFFWLQSLDEPGIAFVLIDPKVFREDFELSPAGDEIEQLMLEDPGDLLSMAIVTIPQDSNKMTANLQGPLVINKKTGLGYQVIQTDNKWKTKHLIFEEMMEAS